MNIKKLKFKIYMYIIKLYMLIMSYIKYLKLQFTPNLNIKHNNIK